MGGHVKLWKHGRSENMEKGASAYSVMVSHGRTPPSVWRLGLWDYPHCGQFSRPSLHIHGHIVLSTGILMLRPTRTKQAPLDPLVLLKTTRKIRWTNLRRRIHGFSKRKSNGGLTDAAANLPTPSSQKKHWLVQFFCIGLNFRCRVQFRNSLAFSDDFCPQVFTVISGHSNAKPRPSFTWRGPTCSAYVLLGRLKGSLPNGNTLITIIGNSSLVRDVCESLMVSVLVSVQGKYVWVRKSFYIFSANKSGHLSA